MRLEVANYLSSVSQRTLKRLRDTEKLSIAFTMFLLTFHSLRWTWFNCFISLTVWNISRWFYCHSNNREKSWENQTLLPFHIYTTNESIKRLLRSRLCHLCCLAALPPYSWPEVLISFFSSLILTHVSAVITIWSWPDVYSVKAFLLLKHVSKQTRRKQLIRASGHYLSSFYGVMVDSCFWY